MTVLGELHCVVLLCGLNISPCTICIRTVDRFLITHTLHYRCLFPSQVKGWCTIIALMMGASVGWGNLTMTKKKIRNHSRYSNHWASGIKDILIKKGSFYRHKYICVFQPLQTGHLTNQDTYFSSKGENQ